MPSWQKQFVRWLIMDQLKKYVNQYQGLNSRMDEIQAAFGMLNDMLITKSDLVKLQKYYIDTIKNDKIILPQSGLENMFGIYL
jgi:dTDP-4-amino-4,6-dideoxygalactose transaminase